MQTKVIEVEFLTEDTLTTRGIDGLEDVTYMDRTILIAVKEPGYKTWRKGQPEPEKFGGSYAFRIDQTDLSVYSAAEARQYIALLEKVAEHFDQVEAEKKAETE